VDYVHFVEISHDIKTFLFDVTDMNVSLKRVDSLLLSVPCEKGMQS